MRYILIILFVILLGCKASSQSKEIDFQNFVMSFDQISFPYDVECILDLFWNDTFDKDTSTRTVKSLKRIDTIYYKYFTKVKAGAQYFNGHVIMITDDLVVLTILERTSENNRWNPNKLYLFSYNRQGDIIDSIVIAGNDFDISDQIFGFWSPKELRTVKFKYLENVVSDEKQFLEREENFYQISNNGRFILVSQKISKGYYKIDDNGCLED